MIFILKQLLTLIAWSCFQYILLESIYNRKKTMTIILATIVIVFTVNTLIILGSLEFFYKVYPITMNLPVIFVFIFISKRKGFRVWFNLLTALFLCSVSHLPEHFYALKYGYNWVGILIEILDLFPLVFVVYRYFRPLYLQTLKNLEKGWGLFCIIPLLHYLLMYLLFMVDINGRKQTGNVISVVVATLMVIVFYLIVIIVFRQTQQKYMMQNEQQILKMQVNALESQSEAVKNAENETIIYRHDMRHYIQHIHTLLESGDTKTAIEFLSNYDEMLKSTKVGYYCENHTINAILSYYLQNAKKEGIEVKTKLDIPEKLPVDAIQICTVFANAIENAINACRKLPNGEKKLIELNCVSNPHFVFEIANTYIGKIQFDEEGFPISKDKGHGIGTISIAAFVKMHNAIIGYKTTGGIFRVRIFLN